MQSTELDEQGWSPFTVTDTPLEGEDITTAQLKQTRAGLIQLGKMHAQAQEGSKAAKTHMMYLNMLKNNRQAYVAHAFIPRDTKTNLLIRDASSMQVLIASYAAKEFGARLRNAVSSPGENVDVVLFETMTHMPESVPADTRELIESALPDALAKDVLIGAGPMGAQAVLDAFSPADSHLTLQREFQDEEKHAFLDGRDGYFTMEKTSIPGVGFKREYSEKSASKPFRMSFSVFHDQVSREVLN